MSGFTERTTHRALGASGRIQPRIQPITAPDPWVTAGDGEGLGLEVVEEVEARRPLAVPRVERPSLRGDERPAVRPERPPEPARPSAPTARPAPDDPLAARSPERQPERQPERRVLAPTVPSFRTPGLDVHASALAPLSASRGSSVVEGLEYEVTVVASTEAPRPAASRRALHASRAAEGEPTGATEASPPPVASRPGLAPPLASEALAYSSSPHARGPQLTARSLLAEPDAPPWATPAPERELALRPASRRAMMSEGPVVRVQIGRVEVRAAPRPEPARAPEGIAKPAAFVSLQQYLHKRGAP